MSPQEKMELIKTFQEKLSDTAKKVFENAAFAMIDMPEEEQECAEASCETRICVMIEFEGHFRGRLAMSASGALAPVLAANMLGVDEDDPDAGKKGTDAIMEILNMVCGNLLPEVAGADVEFRMTAPEVISPDQYRIFESEADDPYSFSEDISVESSPVSFVLTIKSDRDRELM